jgi:hypothetical protein
MVTLEVLNPAGGISITKTHAPRLSNLDGKTIGMLTNNLGEYQRTFPLIQELLQKQFPTAKILPYTEFPQGGDKIDSDEIGKIVQEKGCQAAIIGSAY